MNIHDKMIKESYEDYLKNDFKNSDKYKREKLGEKIFVKCKKCGKVRSFLHAENIFRGFCKKCKCVLVADYKITKNAEKIDYFDYIKEK